jgi:hypothetical protein
VVVVVLVVVVMVMVVMVVVVVVVVVPIATIMDFLVQSMVFGIGIISRSGEHRHLSAIARTPQHIRNHET